jgi:acetyl-CoA carboxylase biotin carboxyl carrier protein
MDIKKIRKLIELLEQSTITEMEIKEGKELIKLSKNPTSLTHHIQQAPQMIVTSSPPFSSNSNNFISHDTKHNYIASDNISKETPVSDNINESKSSSSVLTDQHALKSPMVGTFYKSASPDAKPFVSVGDHVNIGQVLCIIEAMKMFNQIEAEYAGTIEAILVETGQPVEFGQPLFIINPD